MGKYALPPCLMKYAIYFHLTMGKLLTFSRINQNMYTDYCAKIIKSNIVIIVCFTIILAITPIKIIDNLLFWEYFYEVCDSLFLPPELGNHLYLVIAISNVLSY